MLTVIKNRETKLCFLTEQEAEADADKQERHRRLHDAFNRTGG